MRCPKCGSKLPKGSTFCKNCNTPIKKKPSVFERIGKVPLIIGAAVIVIAALTVLFFVITNVPVVKYEKAPDNVKYAARQLEYTFFDNSGNSTGTAKNVTRTFTNKLGTMFAFGGDGKLYIARPDRFEIIDKGVSDSRIFCCAENADVICYEKNKKIYRFNGSPEQIGSLRGIAQFCVISPDGASAAWGESDRNVKTVCTYINGTVSELIGVDTVVSISSGGNTMFGTKDDMLVISTGGAAEFREICKCGSIKNISPDGTQVIFTDEHNPPSTYMYDSAANKKVFMYNGSVTLYAPDGMRQSPENFELFLAEAVDHAKGTANLTQFAGNGSGYTARELLDIDKISRYTVSADGEKILYLRSGKLSLKSTVSSFGKENVIASDVYEYYTDPTLSGIYFVTSDYTLYYSDGGSPVKIMSDTGASAMMCDGVCTFVCDGVLYYSEKGCDPIKAEGIGKIKYLFSNAAVDENDRQYITYDGKNFIDTNVNRS